MVAFGLVGDVVDNLRCYERWELEIFGICRRSWFF